MISVKNALEKVEMLSKLIDTFRINLNNSVSYYLAEDIISPINMPPFRQSAMDGYALKVHNELEYKLVGEIKAGDCNHPNLNSGEAIRIFTGAAVPDSANVVIMQEKVSLKGNNIKIDDNVVVGKNIRPAGEQVTKGKIALKEGSKLTPAAIGFLASLGINEVLVYKKPSIAIVTTGNELVNPGELLSYGQIYESNSGMLFSALQSLGYTNISKHKVKDDYQSTYNLLQQVIINNDVVIITGGISVGDYDFVGKALKEIDVKQVFYKVKQKPGKPLFFGKKDKTTIFALPGNPAAALSCFYVYVNTALQILSGNIDYKIQKEGKTSVSNFIKKGDRAQFLKAIVVKDEVTILEGQSSAMLQTFAHANALVYVPEEVSQINKGDLVEIIRLPNL